MPLQDKLPHNQHFYQQHISEVVFVKRTTSTKKHQEHQLSKACLETKFPYFKYNLECFWPNKLLLFTARLNFQLKRMVICMNGKKLSRYPLYQQDQAAWPNFSVILHNFQQAHKTLVNPNRN